MSWPMGRCGLWWTALYVQLANSESYREHSLKLASYTNSWIVQPSCLTLLLTTDVVFHILQGLTVILFKFHLHVPQAVSTFSFVKPSSYELATDWGRLIYVIPPLREHVCFFTLNNTYSSCYISFVFCFLSTWSVAISTPATHACILCLVHEFYLLNSKCSSQDKPAALTSYEHLGVWLCSIIIEKKGSYSCMQIAAILHAKVQCAN